MATTKEERVENQLRMAVTAASALLSEEEVRKIVESELNAIRGRSASRTS